MSDAASRLPNLYQMLGLSPLESDRGKIAAAIKRLQKPEGADAAASKEELERAGKVAALAQKYLLDPQRKAAFDQQWKSVYQPTSTPTQPAAATATVPASASATPSATATATTAATTAATATVAHAPRWNYSTLEPLLPQGDPQAAFDMASFLRSGGESRDPLAAQADLSRLIALLSDATGGTAPASSAIAALDRPIVDAHEVEEAAGHSLGLAPGSRAGQSGSPSGGLARRMRQRKQRALLFGGAALVAGIGGLLLLGMFLFTPKSDSSPKQLAQVGQEKSKPARGNAPLKLDLDAPPKTASDPQGGQQAAAPAGSGLPKPGEGAMNLASNAAAAPPTESMPEAMPKPSPAPEMKAETKPEMKPEDAPQPEPQPAPQPNPTPSAEAAPESELSADEKRSWQMGMAKAKMLIGQQDFEAAEKQLGSLQATVKTSQQRGQLERLGQVLGFVKDTREAIVEAIAGLGPADSFKVGSSTLASFVEGNDRRLTVRISAKNRSYLIEELPVALGLALVDLKMDLQNASSLARKGAYILTHPKGEAAHERGKQMLQDAAAAGAITPELAKFYEDDYSLSGSGK